MTSEIKPLTPSRTVHCAEALAWMRANPAPPGASIITSLPDLSEVPDMGLVGWSHWFGEAAAQVLDFVPAQGMAIFYQSDIRHAGRWIDKGFWVQQAAAKRGHTLVWHKIVCRKTPGTITHDRASYSHMLCFARQMPASITRPGPDVIVETHGTLWPRAMGLAACQSACRFLVDNAAAHTIVDPFCGYGTALAVANAAGLDAVGVDLSAKRCRAAARVQIREGQLFRPDGRGV